MLNTFELFNMKLNARMAVLSACNSGIGSIQNGEGMMSLARGFYYAGCPNVVMTLWPVEDQVSSVLVKEFYQNLSQGKNKIEALRQAKLKFLEDADPLRAHPYFWASYVNIGDMTPIVDKTSAGFNGYYLIISLLGLVILLFPLLKKWF
jgi:CHAT domain-containing protein